jgi:hypothetical protein
MNTFKWKLTICFSLSNKCRCETIRWIEVSGKRREYMYVYCNKLLCLLNCLSNSPLLCCDPVLIPLIASRRSAHCWLIDVPDPPPPLPESCPPNRDAQPILPFAHVAGVFKYPNKAEGCNSAHTMKQQRSNLIRGLQGHYSNYRYT